jgi:hypothetical protein
MQSEHDRNMNLLRGILGSCEEVLREAHAKGEDGEELWTEEDVENARRMRDWFATQLVAAAPKVRPPKKRARREETIFDDERLWRAVDHQDVRIRSIAFTTTESIAVLAALRAERRHTSFLAERHTIFAAVPLLQDMRSNDAELRKAADAVFCDLMQLIAHLDADTVTLTDEEKRQARELVEYARRRLRELERADAAQETAP